MLEEELVPNILAYELATSLAPLPKAENTNAIEVIANIQAYLAVIGGAILNFRKEYVRKIYLSIRTDINICMKGTQPLAMGGNPPAPSLWGFNNAASQAVKILILRSHIQGFPPWLAI